MSDVATGGTAVPAGRSSPVRDVRLRTVVDEDLELFFESQTDREANRMAAFTAQDPHDRAAFLAHWARLRSDRTVVARTVLADGRVAGNVVMFRHAGQPEVGYWLGREFWGRGVASRALARFLRVVRRRPLFARVAKDNGASLRVLRKCGFQVVGQDRAFAYGRDAEVEEWILRLS